MSGGFRVRLFLFEEPLFMVVQIIIKFYEILEKTCPYILTISRIKSVKHVLVI